MKKTFALITAGLIYIYACKQKTVSHAAAKPDPVKPLAKIDTLPNVEYLDWNAVKINGSVKMLGLKEVMYQSMGKPDSIVEPDMSDVCISFFNKPFKYAYIKGSQFELCGDSIVVSTLNFKGNRLKLAVNSLILDANTTLTSLSKLFPAAVKAQSKMLIKNEKLMSIRLNTSKTSTDDAWILMFDKGKLVRIDYWMPC